MTTLNVDYDGLKKRGFLRQKQDGYFILRTRMPSTGSYTASQVRILTKISQAHAKGILHATVRQGLEIPFIKYEDIPTIEREIAEAGIDIGTSGPRLRATTACPGNNWCKQGLIDTFSLAARIENELGMKCGTDLPHKFKIAISGCPNTCTRPQASEIGIHGQVDPVTKKTGYVVNIGGCGGRTPRNGFKLDRLLTEDEVLAVISKVVVFFKENAKPRQRLALLIEETGRDVLLKDIVI